ncbi:MAG: acyltransferase [Bacteroidales bacterium]|nr:acyltransferase [Bacteroidales bacterium]
MGKKRILYIDLMKGLSITWVVWFHTVHPDFVNYGFRMPLFFLASAIFFKPYPIKEFAEKKIYQIFIPYVVFYLLYYLFMIVSSRMSNDSFSHFDYSCILDVFKPYVRNGGPTVNPPLWFIMALMDLQFTLYILVKLIKSRTVLLLLSFVISIVSIVWLTEVPTFFQFGRAMRYIFYYAFGYLYGKDIIKIIENGGRKSLWLFCACAVVFLSKFALQTVAMPTPVSTSLVYFQITALVILLIYLFRLCQHLWIMKPLKYFGANSYIVLGMNEMILTSIRVWMEHHYGALNIPLGIANWLLTMCCLVPVIYFFNKKAPFLVGKENIFDTRLRRFKPLFRA